MNIQALEGQAGDVSFDGVLRLSIGHGQNIKDLQEKISKAISGQVPIVTRYMHVTLAGIAILKPLKDKLKGKTFPKYDGSVSFEDTPHLAEKGDLKSTFVYADAQTQNSLKEYITELFKDLGIENQEDRRFHLSLTNLTGFGPNSVGAVWLADKGKVSLQGEVMSSFTERLDRVATELEQAGRPDMALAIDQISDRIADTLGDSRDEVIYLSDKDKNIDDKKQQTFRAYLTLKNASFIDINAHTLHHAEGIVEGLGIKKFVISIKRKS
jgi:hypothetical protein